MPSRAVAGNFEWTSKERICWRTGKSTQKSTRNHDSLVRLCGGSLRCCGCGRFNLDHVLGRHTRQHAGQVPSTCASEGIAGELRATHRARHSISSILRITAMLSPGLRNLIEWNFHLKKGNFDIRIWLERLTSPVQHFLSFVKFLWFFIIKITARQEKWIFECQNVVGLLLPNEVARNLLVEKFYLFYYSQNSERAPF